MDVTKHSKSTPNEEDLTAENVRLKQTVQDLQSQLHLAQAAIRDVEVEEERVANSLIKQLDAVKREKERLAAELHNELNHLEAKREEKTQIEHSITQEQAEIAHRKGQLGRVQAEKRKLQQSLATSTSELLTHLQTTIDQLFHQSTTAPPGSNGQTAPEAMPAAELLLASIRSDIQALKNAEKQINEERERLTSKVSLTRRELEVLKEENFLLQQKVEHEQENRVNWSQKSTS
eukprot:GABV01000808.1.p1 GENE.GABV01000808.1~~GABV01000808.1.p1  ORF type:complete len:233 (-),score=82.48 GABV01000808.1:358-1056(-)